MENPQTDNFIQYRLSEEEKNSMRLAVEAHMQALPPGLIKSPWVRFITAPSFLALAALFLCVSTSYASYGSVPGDLLYPVKTHIAEPARLLVAVTAKSEARVQMKIAQERVAEARVLEERSALDEVTAQKLQESFEIHMQAVLAYEGESNANSAKIGFDTDATPFQIYASMIERTANALKPVATEPASVPADSLSAKKETATVSSVAPETSILSIVASTSLEVASTTLSDIANVQEGAGTTTSENESTVTSTDKEDVKDTSSSTGNSDSNNDKKSSVVESVKDTVLDTVQTVSVPSLR